MGMSIDSLSDGILTVHVSGKLTPAEWQAGLAAAVDRIGGSPDKVSVLVMTDQFAGWTRGDWDVSPSQPEFDRHVRRLAIVGAQKWEDLALLFAGKGVRRISIEYFVPSEIEAARRWLSADDDRGDERAGR
jgi:hypothetical protein